VGSLADRDCVPCRGGVPALARAEIEPYLRELVAWTVVEDRRLERRYKVKDFAAALALVNKIGAVAEAQKHHPDLALGWGWVEVKVWTHKVNGLTDADFVLAAKCDREAGPYQSGGGAGSKGSGSATTPSR
jgi:4a-hydroxytetrahydrobiopterin dehydratase